MKEDDEPDTSSMNGDFWILKLKENYPPQQ
jgi:hypothetical protein